MSFKPTFKKRLETKTLKPQKNSGKKRKHSKHHEPKRSRRTKAEETRGRYAGKFTWSTRKRGKQKTGLASSVQKYSLTKPWVEDVEAAPCIGILRTARNSSAIQKNSDLIPVLLVVCLFEGIHDWLLKKIKSLEKTSRPFYSQSHLGHLQFSCSFGTQTHETRPLSSTSASFRIASTCDSREAAARRQNWELTTSE